ncbi:MAG: DegT/DnrJ/EryC1/StrS aminotransferase family protein [Proteobacteria bacterium]|nr:DegT/DnrJ/EryC1/StrS aminotransferase family protein [Pseudomonadota bacterium]
MNQSDRLKQLVSRQFEGDAVFLFWKGRVGLYAILKAWGIGPDDEVIVPAFTCVVVPNAVLYLGAKPVYVDVEEQSLNTTLRRIEAARTGKTKAVICQNTFGLSSEVDVIAGWAASEGLLSVEDCTHGFGGSFHGRPNGSYCDAAFFSSQWNKPVSSGIGGFVVARDAKLVKGLSKLESQLAKPRRSELVSLNVQLWARRKLLTDGTYWTLLKLYRWLSKTGVIIGSSSGEEIDSVTMPKNYFKGMSELQARTVACEIAKLDQHNQQRREAAVRYSAFLAGHGKYHVDAGLVEDHMFLKYPILVRNRDGFFRAAEKFRVELGDWFNSPLHPVQGDLSAWGLDIAGFPNARRIATHIVNLPTRSNSDRVVDFLNSQLDELM